MSEKQKISEEKDVLRKEAMRHRERMAFSVDEDPEKTVDHFFSLFDLSSYNTVAGYWPKGREFDTTPILSELMKIGKTCLLPVVQKKSRLLNFAKWKEGDDLVTGAYDIKHPVINDQTEYMIPDIVLVPMLAFDRRGYRLGYGGGYYDYTLAHYRDVEQKSFVSVGLAFAQQACLFPLPRDEHDQRLDYVITPQTIHSFKED